MEKYSFLASVYRNSKADEMRVCVEGMLSQTVAPDQIVIVIDGPIAGDLKEYIDELAKDELCTIVPIVQNVLLGRALCEGMKHCRNELIARMDTDDIMEKDRIEKQLAVLKNDETISVVGSNIDEFIGTPDNVQGVRAVPETHEEICEYLKRRCPLNHMTVLFKKSEVEKAGGYQHWLYNEDSFLWVRMYLAGCKFYNIQENLVHARIDDTTFQRRGGWKYYQSERDLFKYMYKHKIIGWFAYQKAKCMRFILQVLMPNFIRKWIFKKFARKKA